MSRFLLAAMPATGHIGPLLPIAWLLLRWRRGGVPDRIVVGRYLVLVGALRFAIEFVRVNLRIAGPLTLAHLISGGVIAAGVVLIVRHANAPKAVRAR